MTDKQPKALRLAEWLERRQMVMLEDKQAAAELRRLHEENEALRAALAQPEPVAYWRHTSSINQGWDEFSATKAFDDDIPLYTSPPQREWQGLTDEEIYAMVVSACSDGSAPSFDEYMHEDAAVVRDVARAIEAKLKEKNT